MRKRKSVIVELTSLLDVIFIMLFMVMNRSESAATEAQQKAETEITSAQAQVSQMEETLNDYKDILKETEEERNNLEYINNKLESYEKFNEYAKILSVYVVDGGYKRSLVVADNEDKLTIDYGWDNMKYAEESLINGLKEHIDGTPNPVFISFNYNSDEIYLQDYNMIAEAITAVQSGYKDVYIKFDDRKEN